MEAISALVGAIIGGVLVLVGDAFRRRAERRWRAVERLADAGAGYAMLMNRLCGEVVDAKVSGREIDHAALRAGRYEAATRFFMTPSTPALQAAARDLSNVYHGLLDHFHDDHWNDAFDAYRATIRKFEAAVREVVARGRL